MQILVSLASAVLAALLRVFLQQRRANLDAKEVGRLETVVEQLERTKVAYAWKTSALRRNDVGVGDLRVHDGARSVPVPGRDPGAARAPDRLPNG